MNTRVINATGCIVNPATGGAPLAPELLQAVQQQAAGFTWPPHMAPLTDAVKILTGRADWLLLNNMQSAFFLMCHTFAFGKHIILPSSGIYSENLKAEAQAAHAQYSHASSHQLNQTYTPKTALVLVDEATTADDDYNHRLLTFAGEKDLLVAAICENAMLRLPANPACASWQNSPALRWADLVLIPFDRLLGGPRLCLVAGTSETIDALKLSPLCRMLQPGRLLTRAGLELISDLQSPEPENLVYKLLSRKEDRVFNLAKKLYIRLQNLNINSSIVPGPVLCCAGGSANRMLPSHAVELGRKTLTERGWTAEQLSEKLSQAKSPIRCLWQDDRLTLDMLAIEDADLPYLANTVFELLRYPFDHQPVAPEFKPEPQFRPTATANPLINSQLGSFEPRPFRPW